MRILLVCIALSLAGCSVLGGGSSTTKPISLPPKPVYQQPEMKVAKQQAVDVIVQIANEADSVGISANSQASTTLLDTATVLQVLEGLPVDKVSWEEAEKVKQLVASLRAMEGDYRNKVLEWEELMQRLSENEDELMRMQKTNGTLWSWIVGLGVGLILLCIIFPSVGVPLVFRIIKNLKKGAELAASKAMEMGEEQMSQVVAAIEESKEKLKEHPEIYTTLKDNLRKSTDKSTREVIARLRSRVTT